MAPLGQAQLIGLRHRLQRHMFMGVIVLFTLLRLIFMLKFPIFNDEALTIRYGKIAVESQYHFYTVEVGGKQPLLYWADGIMTHLVPDPLFAGRIISFLFGLGTLLGIYAITKTLSPIYAPFAALVYALSPLNILFDGMAVHDAALTCLFTWIIYMIMRLLQSFKLYPVLSIGILVGIGLWIKTTALLFLAVSGIFVILSVILKKISIRQAALIFLIWAFTEIVMLMPLVLRPEFEGVLRMQREYALTAGDIAKFPIDIWYSNARNILLTTVGYASPLLLIALGYGLWEGKKERHALYLIIIYCCTVMFLILTGKSMHSRYMVFSVVPLIPVTVLLLRKYSYIFIFGTAVMAVLSLVLAVSPSAFFHLFPDKWVYGFDTWQYVDGWPSGYGVGEALAYVDRQRSGKRAFIGVRWDAGNPEDTVLLYAPKLPAIAVGFFDKKLENWNEIIRVMKNYPMYFITRDNQRGGMDDQLTLLARFDKPSKAEAVEVYQFHPQGNGTE